MVVAVIVGVIIGLVSLVPFYFAAKNARKIDATGGAFALLGPFLLTLAVSFIILIVGLIGGKLISPDNVVALAAAEFAAFVIGVIVFGIFLAKRR